MRLLPFPRLAAVPLSGVLAAILLAALAGCTSASPAAAGSSAPASLSPGSTAPASTGSGGPAPDRPPGTAPARWTEYVHLPGVVDMAGPLPGGSYVISAAGVLYLFHDGRLTPFARGRDGYRTNTGGEPYLTTASDAAGPGCRFRADQVFAIEPARRPSVIVVTADGRAREFAALPAGVFLDGITFDGTGRFGHRLLVTGTRNGHTAVFGISCAGAVQVITAAAPSSEGGAVVAPTAFGAFGGDLIVPAETTGLVWAIAPDGDTTLLVRSGLPAGGDIGVESEGFVPATFSAAYLADRYSGPRNKHPGDNSLLRLYGNDLRAAGVRPGDLLIAAEGGAFTIDVRCDAARCAVRYIADGPPIAHAEGHLVVAP